MITKLRFVQDLLNKFGEASTVAIVLTLCACTAVPQVQYPSGKALRTSVNADANGTMVKETVTMAATVAPQIAAVAKAGPAPGSTVVAVVQPQVVSMTYAVNDSEQSVLAVLRRWSRVAKTDFTWNANVDYSITPTMRAIQAQSYAEGVTAMRDGLAGVDIPLTLSLRPQGLFVSLANSTVLAGKHAPKALRLGKSVVVPPVPTESGLPASRNLDDSVSSSACAEANHEALVCSVAAARSARSGASISRWQARQAEVASHGLKLRRHTDRPAG